MSNIAIITLIVVGLGLVYFIKKGIGSRKVKKVVVVDPAAQEAYESAKKHDKNEQKLTLEERIELSWQFLVHIRDQVLNKFSKADRKKVSEMGHVLNENGMHYEHDVNMEISIRQEASKAKVVAKTREDQPEGISR